MKLTLVSHTPQNIKRTRHLLRVSSQRQNVTVRNGHIYTMRYNPGIQPRTEAQEKSWSLFKEANRLATADFHNPSKKAYWQKKLKEQSRYKTARGLAKAYYINLLKARMLHKTNIIRLSNSQAAVSLRPLPHVESSSSASLLPAVPIRHLTWSHYRNVHWFRRQLADSSSPKQLSDHCPTAV